MVCLDAHHAKKALGNEVEQNPTPMTHSARNLPLNDSMKALSVDVGKGNKAPPRVVTKG
jgi:hypothetical protein